MAFIGQIAWPTVRASVDTRKRSGDGFVTATSPAETCLTLSEHMPLTSFWLTKVDVGSTKPR